MSWVSPAEACRHASSDMFFIDACMHAVESHGALAIGGQTQWNALPLLMLPGPLRRIRRTLRILAGVVFVGELQIGISACAAVTAGLIESEIRNNNKCDFDRYYGSTSAYHSIADAIQKRMDILAKVSPNLIRMRQTSDRHRHWLANQVVQASRLMWSSAAPMDEALQRSVWKPQKDLKAQCVLSRCALHSASHCSADQQRHERKARKRAAWRCRAKT